MKLLQVFDFSFFIGHEKVSRPVPYETLSWVWDESDCTIGLG